MLFSPQYPVQRHIFPFRLRFPPAKCCGKAMDQGPPAQRIWKCGAVAFRSFFFSGTKNYLTHFVRCEARSAREVRVKSSSKRARTPQNGRVIGQCCTRTWKTLDAFAWFPPVSPLALTDATRSRCLVNENVSPAFDDEMLVIMLVILLELLFVRLSLGWNCSATWMHTSTPLSPPFSVR